VAALSRENGKGVILSEAKDLGSSGLAPDREATAEILRFAQDDTRRKSRPRESG
jgi:hypothetical protein